jgi:hypothetical protein
MIKGTTPKKIDSRINKIIDLLGLNSKEVMFIKLTKENKFTAELNNCHINNFVKVKLYGGSIVYGWIFYQDKINDFTETQFHSVWCNNDGKIFDITPREDQEKRIMFIPDQVRKIETVVYENQHLIRTFDNIRLFKGDFLNGTKEILGGIGNNLAYTYGLVPALLARDKRD